MKTLRFIVVLILSITPIVTKLSAQKNSSVSICYSYLKTADYGYGWITYPMGFGTSFSLPIIKRLTLHSGLNYIHRVRYEVEERGFPVQKSGSVKGVQAANYNYYVKVQDKFKESLYLLNLGFYYTVIDKKLSLQFGGNLVPMYCHTISDVLSQYYDSTETHFNNKNDYFKLGYKISVRVKYPISNKISIFFEPEQTYYISGRAYYFYNRNTLYPGLQGSLGITYCLQ